MSNDSYLNIEIFFSALKRSFIKVAVIFVLICLASLVTSLLIPKRYSTTISIEGADVTSELYMATHGGLDYFPKSLTIFNDDEYFKKYYESSKIAKKHYANSRMLQNAFRVSSPKKLNKDSSVGLVLYSSRPDGLKEILEELFIFFSKEYQSSLVERFVEYKKTKIQEKEDELIKYVDMQKKLVEDKIYKLKEQLELAKVFEKRSAKKGDNPQLIIQIDEENRFVLGSDLIKKEINFLENLTEFRSEKIADTNSSIYFYNVLTYDKESYVPLVKLSSATKPKDVNSPKRKLIIFAGIFAALLMSILYIVYMYSVTSKENS